MKYFKYTILLLILVMALQCHDSDKETFTNKKIITKNDSLFSNNRFELTDSIIYSNNKPIPLYPYTHKYDSLRKIQNDELDKFMEENPDALTDEFPPIAEIYAVDSLGNEINLKDYLKFIREKYQGQYFCLLSLRVEWNGDISEIRLKGKKGNIPKHLNLNDIARNLRARPKTSNDDPPPPNPVIMNVLIKQID